MSRQSNKNSILVLATLGVYFGLVLVGATPQVLAQAETKTVSPTDQSGVYINVRPMKDFANEALKKLDSRQVALDNPFNVTITGTLGLAKDGKAVILTNVKRGPVPSTGDPATVKFVEEAILALADAGWFGYLNKLDSKTITVSVEQNGQRVLARVVANQPSSERARATASGIRSLLQIAALELKGDDKTILNSATVGSEGADFFVSFEWPNAIFTEIIMNKLSTNAGLKQTY